MKWNSERATRLYFGIDMELARAYELEIDAQFLPLGVYTQEVDYPDVAVQVSFFSTERGSQSTFSFPSLCYLCP